MNSWQPSGCILCIVYTEQEIRLSLLLLSYPPNLLNPVSRPDTNLGNNPIGRCSAPNPLSLATRRKYLIIYRGPGFLAFALFSSSSTPIPSGIVSFSQSSCVPPVELTKVIGGGRGVGKELNHTTARKPVPLNTLWIHGLE
jgi:hypothetical protein